MRLSVCVNIKKVAKTGTSPFYLKKLQKQARPHFTRFCAYHFAGTGLFLQQKSLTFSKNYPPSPNGYAQMLVLVPILHKITID